MHGSNINYAEHMDLCAQRLARVLFTRIAVALMDQESVDTLDLLDNFEDEILEASSNPSPSRLVEMRDALTVEYRSEFSTDAIMKTLTLIASIPARYANAQQAAAKKVF